MTLSEQVSQLLARKSGWSESETETLSSGGKREHETISAARIARTGAIVAAVIALAGVLGPHGVTLVKGASSDARLAEVQYFKEKAKLLGGAFAKTESELVRAEDQVEVAIKREVDPRQASELRKVKDALATARKTTQFTRSEVMPNVEASVEATKRDEGVSAAVLRNDVNQTLSKEAEDRRKAIQILEEYVKKHPKKSPVDFEINSDELRFGNLQDKCPPLIGAVDPNCFQRLKL